MTNLSSNIPHDIGLVPIENWIYKFPNIGHDKIPKEFVLKSLLLSLENNFIHFYEMVYRQKLSTAMGTIVAPTCTTLVLGLLRKNSDKTFKHLLEHHGNVV